MNILTRITDLKIPCVYIHVCQKIKKCRPGPYNSLRHADNIIYFLGLSLTWNREEALMFYCRGKWEKFGDVLGERKVTLSWLMDSNMVKPKQFDHPHLVYHFTEPLRLFSRVKRLKINLLLRSPQKTSWCSNLSFF